MKKLAIVLPMLLASACIQSHSSPAPKWDETRKGVWAITLVNLKKDIADCYNYLHNEEFDKFQDNCDAYKLGSTHNFVLKEFNTYKAKYPEMNDYAFIEQEFAAADVAMEIVMDYGFVKRSVSGYIVSFELAHVMLNH